MYLNSFQIIIGELILYRHRTVDEVLPKAIFDGIHGNLVLLGAILVTATVNPYFLIPVIVMGALFIFVRMVYLKTSKNIMRIEGIGKQKLNKYLNNRLIN